MTSSHKPSRAAPPPEIREQPSRLKGFILSVLIMVCWIWGLNWLFTRFTGSSYFWWYVQNGTLVSVLTAFLALVWDGLEAHRDLLSWHPGKFIRACANLGAVFFTSVSANLSGPLDGETRLAEDSMSILETLWDAVCAVLMAILMGVAVFGWVFVVAPLYYVLTLITGAPARMEMRGTGRRVVVKTDGLDTTILNQPRSLPVPERAVDVSFAVRPFALTNALNAAVLFLAKLLLPAG